MLGTKIFEVLWVTSIVAVPVVEKISPQGANHQLSTGNTQQVLAIVILGLSAAFVWHARRREKDLQDEKNDWRDWMKRERERSDKVTGALERNSSALEKHAESGKSLEKASYHMAEVVRQCRGNTFDKNTKET